MTGYNNENASLMEDAQKLAKRFKDSALYRDYLQYKNAIAADPDLLSKVQAYKKSSLELETKRLRDGTVAFDEEKRMSYKYTELSLHPEARAFLDCEYELLLLYRQSLDIICEACQIDFDHL